MTEYHTRDTQTSRSLPSARIPDRGKAQGLRDLLGHRELRRHREALPDEAKPPHHSTQTHTEYIQYQWIKQMAAESNHGNSFGLLGYMYALGLGVEKDLDKAHTYFVSASIEGDALGQNEFERLERIHSAESRAFLRRPLVRKSECIEKCDLLTC